MSSFPTSLDHNSELLIRCQIPKSNIVSLFDDAHSRRLNADSDDEEDQSDVESDLTDLEDLKARTARLFDFDSDSMDLESEDELEPSSAGAPATVPPPSTSVPSSTVSASSNAAPSIPPLPINTFSTTSSGSSPADHVPGVDIPVQSKGARRRANKRKRMSHPTYTGYKEYRNDPKRPRGPPTPWEESIYNPAAYAPPPPRWTAAMESSDPCVAAPSRNAKKHASRGYKRQLDKLQAEVAASRFDAVPQPLSERGTRIIAQSLQQKISPDFNPRKIRVSVSGYTGLSGKAKQDGRAQYDKSRSYTAEELLEMGFELIEWDGVHPMVLCDSHGRIFAVLAGRPDDPSYLADMTKLFKESVAVARGQGLHRRVKPHRRGSHPAFVDSRLYHGQGTEHPQSCVDSKLKGSERRREAVYGITRGKLADRARGFAEDTFQRFNPRIHERYFNTNRKIIENQPELLKTLGGKIPIYGSTSFNVPAASRKHRPAITYIHDDYQNPPDGWCAVLAMGDYDHTRGGHEVLWDLGLVIQFPHAALIHIPSAILRHSNTAIQKGENRASLTWYSSGQLFQWADNGFRLQRETPKPPKAPRTSRKSKQENMSQRWIDGYNDWLTWDELLKSHEVVGPGLV